MKRPALGLGISLGISVLTLLSFLVSPHAAAEDKPTDPAGEEFFERKIRPILVQHCLRCHGPEKTKGGLRLDSLAGALKGGDNGPALVPGSPDKSRLIEAIGYGNTDLLMPPKGKLPDPVLADLNAWVKRGAPWPGAGGSTTPTRPVVDILQQNRDRWCWRPIQTSQPPAVRDASWPRDPVDRFILARLEEKGLKPAALADRRTLLRRVTFDLTGLPPTPEEIDAFLADQSPDAYDKVVDRLLASPAYGERWGRHWLDLVRYGESRGHEFDPNVPNAYQYRDYVIRALNADLPYDQFVREHLAGDLLPTPRRHPTTGGNESVLGTGFWLLGEEVHSPVDIRQDQADRFDNRIDVFTKTFLGLTVACARCHDHKFDPIPTRDYYGLFGFLSSSSYRLVRFDSLEQNRTAAAALAQVRTRARGDIGQALARAAHPATDRLADYLLAARAVVQAGPSFSPAQGEVVFEDFSKGTYEDWEVVGTAFGDRPQTLATIAPYQGKINAVNKYFVNSHNIRNGEDLAAGDAHKGTLTSRPFTLEHAFITLRVGGGSQPGKTCVNLLVDGKVVRSATGRNDNQLFPVRWDVRSWKGKTARIQVVDDASGPWGNIGLDHIVFTNQEEGTSVTVRAEDFSKATRQHLEDLATRRKLDPTLLAAWTAALLNAARDRHDPLHAWALASAAASSPNDPATLLRPLTEELRRQDASAATALDKFQVAIDYATSRPADWRQDEASFGTAPARPGDVHLAGCAERPTVHFIERAAAEYDRAFDVLRLAPGTENDPGALGRTPLRAGRTLCTPSFKLTTGKVWYLVRGAGSVYAAVSAHAVIDGPLHGQLVQNLPAGNEFHWHGQDLTRYQGLDVHLEFTAAPGADFAVALVVQGDQPPGALDRPSPGLLRLLAEDGKTIETLAAGYQRLFAEALRQLESDTERSTDTARLANWLVRHPELLGPGVRSLDTTATTLLNAQQQAAAGIKAESRLAPSLMDGSSIDEHVFIRGSPKAEGEVAPRHLLQTLAGAQPPTVPGSGRLELARQVTDPSVNPFVARVLVNRTWHHLFGRGLVASVDNFGTLGEEPTHPELLDYLVTRFLAEGWSNKRLIRELVLSSTYRMASTADPEADRLDPSNLLLHRARLRRLEGEAIRDAMLSVSGRLDRTLYGPSVPIHLTAFLEGRGRPASGPLDGDGRRSVYLAVRRNFLSPFLMAFDTPSPFSTVGRRTVSNVPAQALILMNDPFVAQQAEVWACRMLATPGSTEERVQRMYTSAFGRPPSDDERQACAAFLSRQATLYQVKPEDPKVWTDLAHTLFNVKEFIFLE
jgi:hypothetical protein